MHPVVLSRGGGGGEGGKKGRGRFRAFLTPANLKVWYLIHSGQ